MSSVHLFWVFFLKSCLQASIEYLTQAFLELWQSPKARRVRRWLRSIFLASFLLRMVVRLLAGQTAWATFLDDLTINILASLILD